MALSSPSFVPPQPIEELRQLTRTRKQLVHETSRHALRIQKVLEDANIKIGSVVTDVLGATGRAILDGIIAGVTDPHVLAGEARGSLINKRKELAEALEGRVTDHHRFLLKLHLSTIGLLEGQIAELDQRLGGALSPFGHTMNQVKTIPGIGELTGTGSRAAKSASNMSQFTTPRQLVSWAGLCPRSDESAGKKRSTRVRKATPWLKATLTQAAWGAARSKNTYLHAQYFRIKVRRGSEAVLAVAASMLTIVWHMLTRGTFYEDLGPDYFDRRDKARAAKRTLHPPPERPRIQGGGDRDGVSFISVAKDAKGTGKRGVIGGEIDTARVVDSMAEGAGELNRQCAKDAKGTGEERCRRWGWNRRRSTG